MSSDPDLIDSLNVQALQLPARRGSSSCPGSPRSRFLQLLQPSTISKQRSQVSSVCSSRFL